MFLCSSRRVFLLGLGTADSPCTRDVYAGSADDGVVPQLTGQIWPHSSAKLGTGSPAFLGSLPALSTTGEETCLYGGVGAGGFQAGPL